MKAGEILINGIFNGSRLLEVPFYQRAYVWDDEQWDRFLTDMEFVTKTKKPYFLGSIIFKSGKTPNTWDHFSDCIHIKRWPSMVYFKSFFPSCK